MTSQNSSGWSTWAVNTLVKSPLSWSVGRIKESILSPTTAIDEKSEYVILHLVEVTYSKFKIVSTVKDSSDSIFECNELS